MSGSVATLARSVTGAVKFPEHLPIRTGYSTCRCTSYSGGRKADFRLRARIGRWPNIVRSAFSPAPDEGEIWSEGTRGWRRLRSYNKSGCASVARRECYVLLSVQCCPVKHRLGSREANSQVGLTHSKTMFADARLANAGTVKSVVRMAGADERDAGEEGCRRGGTQAPGRA